MQTCETQANRYNASMRRAAAVISLAILLAANVGCVRRTISIDSTPPGALVWVNDQELGRTPFETDFLFYGTYDVRLVHPEREPQLTTGHARPPLWDNIPLDLAAEMLPMHLQSRVHWHYDLEPRQDEPEALLQRANQFRARVSVGENASSESSESPETRN